MNVYDRLYDQRSYTGVYRKRFEGNSRINNETQISNGRINNYFMKSDETIHCISSLMRPNLKYAANSNVSPPPAPTSNQNVETSEKILLLDISDPHSILKYVFKYYCKFGRTSGKGKNANSMDNSNFAKFCRDCENLFDDNFTKTEVDLIFAKAKKKGFRRLNYARFLDALGMISMQKFPEMDLEESVPIILNNYIINIPCVKAVTDKKDQIDDKESGNTISNAEPTVDELPKPPSTTRLSLKIDEVFSSVNFPPNELPASSQLSGST